MAAKGEVDLVIRAKNEATKNLDQINKSLKDLADQQAIVGDSAGKADAKLAQLSLELARLRTNAQNLKALGTIGEVMDKATAAMNRQMAAAAETAAEITRLNAKQGELGSRSATLAANLTAATAELKTQDTALKAAKASLSELSRETTALGNQEKSLQGSITSTAAVLNRRQESLEKARARQAELTAAIAASGGATKVQQNSLDAANRTLERRAAAVAESVAKEAALRASLVQNKAAQEANAAALVRATAALTDQSAKTAAAKANLAALKAESTGLGAASRTLAADLANATAAAARETAALAATETEMVKIRAAAAAAGAALAGSTAGTNDAAAAAGKAAVQVAIFAARLAALAGASGRTSAPLGLDPAAIRSAQGAIAQLGVTIRLAANETTRGSVSAQELTAALKGVGQAKSTLEGIGAAIKSQGAAVDGAKAAWAAAQAEVKRLAQAMKEAGTPSTELATALGKAQGAARIAKDEFTRQSTAAAELASQLKNAGLGSGTLSSAEAALAPSLVRVNGLLNQGKAAADALAAANRNAGNGANDAAPKVSKLAAALASMVAAANGAAGATNPLTRFKTEILGIVAASAGLYAVKEQLTGLWQAGANLEANQIKFSTAFDGVQAGAEELAYAREVALNLKLPLQTLTKNYGDLALAAKGTGLEGEGARKIFIAFAQTARVTQMSSESLDGTFKALTQVISKGKVQMEELRGQLGDRLPGALQLMASGLDVSSEKLETMLQKGQLTRDALLSMAAAASGRVGPALLEALNSPTAKLQDFQNRLLIFKETVAGAGFLDAIADAFDRLAKALTTPEAIQAARDLGKALGDMVTWTVELVSSGNLDTITSWLKGFGAAWVALQMASIITGLYGFTAALGATTVAVFALDVALTPVVVGLAAVASVVATVAGAFALWKLAEWAYENVPAFAEGVLTIKNAAKNAWDGILEFWEMTWVKLRNSFAKGTAWIADSWYGLLDTILNSFPDLTKSLGLGDFGADIAKRAAEASAALKENEANLQSDLDAIKSKYAEKEKQREQELQDDIAGYYTDRIKATLTEEEKAAGKSGAAALMGDKKKPGVSFPGAPEYDPNSVGTERITAAVYKPDGTKEAEAAAKKAAAARLSLEKSVADQMFTIRSQLEKKSAQTTDEAIAAVPAKYAALYGKLTALGKDRNSEEWKTVDALVAQEQRIIKQTADKKALAAQAKADRQEAAAETKSQKEAMTVVNALMQTRKNIQDQIHQAQARGDTTGVDELKAKLATTTVEANNAIAGMLAYWQAVGGPQADAAIAKLQAAQLQITKTKTETEKFQNKVGEAFGKQMSSGIDSFVSKVAETGDVFGSVKEAFLDFARSFLIEIAQMILKQLAFNAIKAGLSAIGGGGAIGAGISSVGASQLHSGGTAGAPGTGGSQRRMVDPSIFAGAARFHNGGVPGLKSNEVPAVLQAGEVVRTQQQEKALADRQAMASAGGSGDMSVKIVNTIDTGSMVSEGLNTAAGQKAITNLIKANRTSIKQILGN